MASTLECLCMDYPPWHTPADGMDTRSPNPDAQAHRVVKILRLCIYESAQHRSSDLPLSTMCDAAANRGYVRYRPINTRGIPGRKPLASVCWLEQTGEDVPGVTPEEMNGIKINAARVVLRV